MRSKKIILPLFFFFLISNNLLGAEAFVRIISDIDRGSGSYLDPFVIRSKTINFEVDVYGDDAADCLYWVQVHMDGNRNCSTQYEKKDMTYAEVTKFPFSFTSQLPGWFYIRVDIKQGLEYYMQDFERYQMHVYVEVPPSISYTQPYIPPANNQKPVEQINILNAVSGSGVYGDPYILNNLIVQFRFDQSYDPNGFMDLKNGLFLWCIETHGNHPIYSGGGGIRTEAETFFNYSSYQNKIYEWDTRIAPSNDNYYLLYFWIIDQWGVCNNNNPRIFRVFEDQNGDDEPTPVNDITPPAVPNNLVVDVMD